MTNADETKRSAAEAGEAAIEALMAERLRATLRFPPEFFRSWSEFLAEHKEHQRDLEPHREVPPVARTP